MAWNAEQKISEADDNKPQQDEIARQETIANKREEIRKALEQEIALITKKAKLEGKNIQSEEIQKQILNARVNAYTALIKEFGDAGEEEKRTFAELRAEYAQLDVEAADRLQGDNLKNLERQKQEILEKAELEDRAVDSLEVRKELLDAEVQAYGNQLKILRELIDGTAEEDTVRRRALQASWDQYRAEQMTAAAQKRRLEDLAEAQKKRLEDLAKAQKNFAGSASSLYESAVKEAKDSENQRNSEKLSDAEKKAMEDYQKWFLPFWTDTQRQREAAAVTAINNAAEHEKLMAKQTADDKISKTQKEWEELQKNKEKQTEWIADHNREVEEKYRLTVEKINKQATTEQKTYRAETDDTLKDIAQKYGTTIKAILALNKEIKNPDIIYPGQVITISEGLTPEEKNNQLLAAEADKNKDLLNLAAGKDEAMKQAMIQAENQYTEARRLIYQEMDDQIVAIEEDTNEKIKNLDKTKWEQLKQNASDYLNAFTQAANSLFSIWNSVIDAELEAKLRENDEMVQSDEEREKREKELRREAAMDKYKADVAQYAMNIILANGQAALGVLTAQAQSGPPGAIVAAVLGALNVALVVAAKPKPPRFHQGGVAQGASGQEVPAVLKAGEVVLTPSQFQNTMAAIAQLAHGNGGGDGVSLNVDVKNYSSGARVEKPVFDRGALHMIIRDEVNTMYGSGELDRGIARKESRDRGIIIE
ncbi:MAG: LysM peptidoglycan-binding domain-containing protein [Treponema sp.]|nr:LysM peptidoglycan-binding domain-containing protein [Treponema sp.]